MQRGTVIGHDAGMTPPDDHRFRDPRTHVHDLTTRDIWVVCPRCTAAAVVRPALRRLSCTRCAHTDARRPTAVIARQGTHDPYFGRPLWLQASCCGGRTLWALGPEHLDLLDGYVRARLRERGPGRIHTSLLERLPAWIKNAKHRAEITRTIQHLRATATLLERP
jgi:hypothetical protein